MAFGAYVNMGNGRKLRASGAMAAPEVKKAATKAAARITKAVEGAREAIGDGTLIEHKPEVVGVRVYLHERQDVELRNARSFKVSDDRMLSVSGVGGELAHFGYWVGVELIFSTKRRG